MNFIKFFFLFVLTVFFQISIQAQEWVSYQSQGKINDLIDTGTELLMATDYGLVVMNKTTLEKTFFDTGNSNLFSNHIESITQAATGEVWIGTYDLALMRFDGTDFHDLSIPEGNINTNTIKLYDLEIAENGDFWVGSSQGAFHKQGTNWSQYAEAELGSDFFAVWDIEINNVGEVFLGDFHVHKFANGVFSNISETSNLLTYIDSELFLSNSGDIYYAGDLDSIGRFDGIQWESTSIPNIDNNFFNGSQITGFAEDANGDIYINTQYNGIFKLIGDTWTPQVDAQTTAFNNRTHYFYIDSQDNRWLNDNIHLSVNKNGSIQSTLIAETTLENNNIEAIHKGANGHLYFVTYSEENYSVLAPDGTWSFLPYPTTFVPFEFKNDLLYLAEDDIWIATNNGLHHYDGTQWTLNPLGLCRSLAMDSQDKIYVLGSDRIYIIENGLIINEYNGANSSLITNILTSIGVDANDNLWIASFTWEGANAIQKLALDGTWTTYDGTDHPAINDPEGDFHFDVNGNVWVPSGSVGAMKFDGTTWSNPIQENISNLANYNAFSIESDATGKVYFSNHDGVTTLLDGEWEELIIENFQNSSQNSYIKIDDQGTLWWGLSPHGVFALDLNLGFALSAKALLEGAYDTNGLMRTDLTALISNAQPYNESPWFYSGSETLSAIPSDMVDWVLVEARIGTPDLTSTPGTMIVETQAAILLENGDIVGTDGAPLRFINLIEGADYYFAIRHRNHLPILTATPITLSPEMSYDFTMDINMAFGPEQQKMTTDGKAVLYSGDANNDNVIQVTDYDQWLANPAALDIYQTTDFNLDGIIQVTDYDLWFENKAKLGIGEF